MNIVTGPYGIINKNIEVGYSKPDLHIKIKDSWAFNNHGDEIFNISLCETFANNKISSLSEM